MANASSSAPTAQILSIPEPYAYWLQLAALRFAQDDAQSVVNEAKTTSEKMAENEFHARHFPERRKPLDWLMSDVEGTVRSLTETLESVGQVCNGATEVSGSAEVLAYLLDTFCREIASEALSAACSPLEGTEDLATVIEALGWARSEIDRLREVAEVERVEAQEARKAVKV